MAKNKFRILPDFLFTINRQTNQRELKQDFLEQVLDAIAECNGGYSICRQGLILFDDNGDKFLGTIVTSEETTDWVFTPITD